MVEPVKLATQRYLDGIRIFNGKRENVDMKELFFSLLFLVYENG